MFNSKKKQLKGFHPKASAGTKNAFLRGGIKQDTIKGENGAKKYRTGGNPFTDQFSKTASYRAPRSYQDVANDMAALWGVNARKAVQFIIYIRLISRVVSFFNGVSTKAKQVGQGLRHEGQMRMLWLAANFPGTFYRNVELFIVAGSWKDIIEMMSKDIEYHDWDNKILDHSAMADVILAGLENPSTSELVKKYLPQIKSRRQCTTVRAQARNYVAKYLCSKIFGTKMEDYRSYKSYRKLKSNGTAHTWQQIISKGDLRNLDFNTVHGRALSMLVSSNFLRNNGLEAKFNQWISSQPVAKYTGYVYELFANMKHSEIGQKTLNAQFAGLVDSAQASNLLVVLDESGSMNRHVPGANANAITIARSLLLYFTHTLKGAFSGYYYRFARNGNVRQLVGHNPYAQYMNLSRSQAAGNTDFQAVADFFVEMKKQGVPLKDFPEGILCISDNEFDVANRRGKSTYGGFTLHNTQTNYEMFMRKMRTAGFPQGYLNNFKIILWDVLGNKGYEEMADCPGLVQLSGFDGATIGLILGQDTTVTTENTLDLALDQEIMRRVEL